MASLTEFLIELSASPELRDAYQDAGRREELLRQRGLADHAALQPDASLAQLQAAVASEPGSTAGIDWWILANQAPIASDSLPGLGGDPQGGGN